MKNPNPIEFITKVKAKERFLEKKIIDSLKENNWN